MNNKIVRLRAENIKRLSAVEITPEGNVVVIGGQNAQGKSSVLDSIMYALAGARSIPSRPVRDGADKGIISLDLGDITVTRSFTAAGNSYIQVENADGYTAKSPQQLLDKLTGALCFDPLEFSRKDKKAQLAVLKELLGLDFTEEDKKRKELYDARTLTNKQIAQLKTKLADHAEDPGAPTERVSVKSLLEDLEAARGINRDNEGKRALLNALQIRIKEKEQGVLNLQWQIEALQRDLEQLYRQRHEQDVIINGLTWADEKGIQHNIAQAEEINNRVDAQRQRGLILDDLKELEASAVVLTEKITKIDRDKAEAVASKPFPMEGLSFNEEGVLYQGIPLDQASSAEQLRVSVAMGFALHPQLKVLLIRDGSLLDNDNLALIADMAAKEDGQIWIERVGEGQECQVIIEDGHVKGKVSAEEPEPAEAA